MHPRLTYILRASLLAAVLGTATTAAAPAQRADGVPTSVTLPLEWDGIDGDAVRFSYTAEGQLYIRVAGAHRANLLVEPLDASAFATALRAYVERVEAAGSCAAGDRDAMARVAARRVHMSGIGGIAIGCSPGSAEGGGAGYLVHVTRPSAADGAPVEALPVPISAGEMRTFVSRLGRLVASRQR